MEKGHLSDEFLEGLGFSKDTNFEGEEVSRNAGITNECCQRAKCLSHEYQRKLRRDVLVEQSKKQIEKRNLERARAIEFHRLNDLVENSYHLSGVK